MHSFSKFSSMMFSSLMVVVILQMLLLRTLVADVVLSVNPAQIDVGLSPSLDLNCTFSMTASAMAEIISLTVSRENNTVLASITSFADHQASVVASEGITADGVIKPGGQSYIYLHWDYPLYEQEGTYLCIARGIDNIGDSIETVNTSVVTVREPDVQDLLGELKKLKQNLQHLQTSFKQMLTFMTQLENNVSVLSGQKDNEFDLTSVFLSPPLSYNHKRYYVSKAIYQDVNDSNTTCKAFGGILAEINDVLEYHAIQKYMRTILVDSHVRLLFIAGTDAEQNGRWVLPSSGQLLPVYDWCCSDPSAAGLVGYDCLALYVEHDWTMFRMKCHFDQEYNNYNYMCEI